MVGSKQRANLLQTEELLLSLLLNEQLQNWRKTQRFSRQVHLWAGDCRVLFTSLFLCVFSSSFHLPRCPASRSPRAHHLDGITWGQKPGKMSSSCIPPPDAGRRVVRRWGRQRCCLVSLRHAAENIACAPTCRKTQLVCAAKALATGFQEKKKDQLLTADGALASVAPPCQPDAPLWILLMLLQADFLHFSSVTRLPCSHCLSSFPSHSQTFAFSTSVFCWLVPPQLPAPSRTGSLPAGPSYSSKTISHTVTRSLQVICECGAGLFTPHCSALGFSSSGPPHPSLLSSCFYFCAMGFVTHSLRSVHFWWPTADQEKRKKNQINHNYYTANNKSIPHAQKKLY